MSVRCPPPPPTFPGLSGNGRTMGVGRIMRRGSDAVAETVAAARAALFPDYVRGEYVNLGARGTTFMRKLDGPPGSPVLMLMHGLTATAALNWNTVMRPLSKHFTVIAMDERGHGRGIRPHGPFRLEDAADDAAALLDKLGVQKAVVAGYSMGGPIAQLMWKQHPDKVAGLVLAATGARFTEAIDERTPLDTVAGIAHAVDHLPVALRPTWLPGARWGVWDFSKVLGEIGRNDQGAVIEATDALAHFDSTPWLSQVNVPTAILRTKRDLLVPPKTQSQMEAEIPGTTVYPITSWSGHLSVALAPTEFVHQFERAALDVARRAGLIAPGGRTTVSLGQHHHRSVA